MNAEEWFDENGYEGVKSVITPTLQTVEGYPEFYKHKIMAAFKAGGIQVKDKCYEKLKEKDVIIEFLKKELIHKSSYRQVMKRQYRELKQKCDSLQRYKDCIEWLGEEDKFKSFLSITKK